jgi:hypothetical protein
MSETQEQGEAAQDALAEAEAIVGAMGLAPNVEDEESGAAPEPEKADGEDASEEEGEPEKGEPEGEEEKPDDGWKQDPDAVAAKAEEAEKQLKLASEKRAEFQKRYNVLERREKKLRASVDKYRQSKSEQDTMVRWLTTNLDAIRNGDAATKLQALGALTGKAGHDFYEELSLGLASDGKIGDKSTREVQELRQQIAQLQRFIQGQQQQSHATAQQGEIAEFRATALELGKGSENPVISRIAETSPDLFQDEAQRIAMTFRQQSGRAIDRATLLGRLSERFGAFEPLVRNGTAPQDGGTDLETVAKAKPGTARRSPRGQSISRASAGGAPKRDLSDDERRKIAADLIPDDWIRQH